MRSSAEVLVGMKAEVAKMEIIFDAVTATEILEQIEQAIEHTNPALALSLLKEFRTVITEVR